jgi:hypothetical protein
LQVERPGERRTEGSGLQYLAIPMFLVGMSILRAMVNQPERPPVPPFRLPDDGRLTAPGAWKVRTPPPFPVPATDTSPARATRSAITGHRFRQAAGGTVGSTFDFRPDGAVMAGTSESDILLVHRWDVGDDGTINIVSPGVGLVARLTQVRVLGNVYATDRDGRPELYVRERH